MAQELLTTFSDEVTELSLKPVTGGIFEVIPNDKFIWSGKAGNRFPEITELKPAVYEMLLLPKEI